MDFLRGFGKRGSDDKSKDYGPEDQGRTPGRATPRALPSGDRSGSRGGEVQRVGRGGEVGPTGSALDAGTRAKYTAAAATPAPQGGSGIVVPPMFGGGPKEVKIDLLIDCTSSMGYDIERSARALGECSTYIQRFGEATSNNRVIGFRDYDDRELLEVSPRHNTPDPVVNFLRGLRAYGGGDLPEAIEHALLHSWENDRPSMVVLVGDAPGHSRAALDRRQKRDVKTDEEIALVFGQAGIPIYTFAVTSASSTVKRFEQIAENSGGASALLLSNATQEMMQMLTLAALDKAVGGAGVAAFASSQALTASARTFVTALAKVRK